MSDTGECTLDTTDFLFADDVMHAARSKGAPFDGFLKLTLKPGITYITTNHPDGTIHIRWEPTKKGQESAL